MQHDVTYQTKVSVDIEELRPVLGIPKEALIAEAFLEGFTLVIRMRGFTTHHGTLQVHIPEQSVVLQ